MMTPATTRSTAFARARVRRYYHHRRVDVVTTVGVAVVVALATLFLAVAPTAHASLTLPPEPTPRAPELLVGVRIMVEEFAAFSYTPLGGVTCTCTNDADSGASQSSVLAGGNVTDAGGECAVSLRHALLGVAAWPPSFGQSLNLTCSFSRRGYATRTGVRMMFHSESEVPRVMLQLALASLDVAVLECGAATPLAARVGCVRTTPDSLLTASARSYSSFAVGFRSAADASARRGVFVGDMPVANYTCTAYPLESDEYDDEQGANGGDGDSDDASGASTALVLHNAGAPFDVHADELQARVAAASTRTIVGFDGNSDGLDDPLVEPLSRGTCLSLAPTDPPTPTPSVEKVALRRMYDALNGKLWTMALAGWHGTKQAGVLRDPCGSLGTDENATDAWQQPTQPNGDDALSLCRRGAVRICYAEDGNEPYECGYTTHIDTVDLRMVGTTGRLDATAVAGLVELRQLIVANNAISGTLPGAALASLVNLTHVQVSANRLSGALPSTLSRAERLEVLEVHRNSLTGTLPSSYSSLASLRTLRVSGNRLTGTVPEALGALSGLKSLVLSLSQSEDNSFDGPLPASMFARLRNLEVLYAAHNARPLGTLPEMIATIGSRLQLLDLSESGFSGTLPASFANLTGLDELRLSGNSLTGTIPSNLLSLMTALTRLELGQNALSGTIPSNFGVHTPPVPPATPTPSVVGGTPLPRRDSEQMPTLLSPLELIDLSQNQLSGALPSEFGLMANLEVLQLATNSLSGLLPTTIGNAAELVVLDVSDNSMSGALPSEIGALQQLEQLSVARNRFDGLFPTEIASLAYLSEVFLGGNLFTSFDAALLRVAQSLAILDLSDNLIERIDNSLVVNRDMSLFLDNNPLRTFDLSRLFVPAAELANFTLPFRLLSFTNCSIESHWPFIADPGDRTPIADKIVLRSNRISSNPAWRRELEYLTWPSRGELDLANNDLSGDNFLPLGIGLSTLTLSGNERLRMYPRPKDLTKEPCNGRYENALACLLAESTVEGVAAVNYLSTLVLDNTDIEFLDDGELSAFVQALSQLESLSMRNSGQSLELSALLAVGVLSAQRFLHTLDFASNNLTGSVHDVFTNERPSYLIDLSNNALSCPPLPWCDDPAIVGDDVGDGSCTGCLTECGDGFVGTRADGTIETCDDGNTEDDDGCSATCNEETGWRCEWNGDVDEYGVADPRKNNECTASSGSSTTAIIIAVVLCVFVLLVMAIVGALLLRRVRRKHQKQLLMRVTEDELELDRVIGGGEFGLVYLGTWKDANVVIKRIKVAGADGADGGSGDDAQLSKAERKRRERVKAGLLDEFLEEATLLAYLRVHPNIVQYLGMCHHQDGTISMLTEYIAGGSLDRYMKMRDANEFALSERLEMVLGVAAGMRHLQDSHLLHLDLAARNVLVDATRVGGTGPGERARRHFVCKITDFGLSGSALERAAKRTGAVKYAPKWAAPETVVFCRHLAASAAAGTSLRSSRSPLSLVRSGGSGSGNGSSSSRRRRASKHSSPAKSSSRGSTAESTADAGSGKRVTLSSMPVLELDSAADVWSFGVAAWEIFVSCKSSPYPGYNNAQVLANVPNGLQCPRASTCPESIHEILQRCWELERDRRPAFPELQKLIKSAARELAAAAPNADGGGGGGGGGIKAASAAPSSSRVGAGAVQTTASGYLVDGPVPSVHSSSGVATKSSFTAPTSTSPSAQHGGQLIELVDIEAGNGGDGEQKLYSEHNREQQRRTVAAHGFDDAQDIYTALKVGARPAPVAEDDYVTGPYYPDGAVVAARAVPVPRNESMLYENVSPSTTANAGSAAVPSAASHASAGVDDDETYENASASPAGAAPPRPPIAASPATTATSVATTAGQANDVDDEVYENAAAGAPSPAQRQPQSAATAAAGDDEAYETTAEMPRIVRSQHTLEELPAPAGDRVSGESTLEE